MPTPGTYIKGAYPFVVPDQYAFSPLRQPPLHHSSTAAATTVCVYVYAAFEHSHELTAAS